MKHCVLSVTDSAVRWGGDLHASHAQNTHNSQLSLLPHVQLTHDEDWQNTHREITQRRKCTVHVGHGDDNVDADAVTLNTGVHGGPCPKV